MPSLLERLEAVESQVALLRSSTEERALVTALRTRRDQLSTVASSLDQQLAALERVKQMGGRVSTRPRLSAALREKPRAMCERVTKNPDEVARDQQWEATLLGPLGTFAIKIEECVRAAWQNLVDQKIPNIKDDVLVQLEKIGFGDQVSKVRAARDRIRYLRGRIPESDAELREVENCSKAIEHVLRTLDHVPLAVQAFLAKAAVQNASLDDLTPEVRAWLLEKDMLKLITLGLR